MNKERLTTFIDAVLAIIMTILVLELEKPNPVTIEGFFALKENFFAYALSFFWLGAMWVNLHNEWYHVEKISKKTVWATLLFLFFSSLFPYATNIVSTNFNNEIAQSFYGLIVIAITLSNVLLYTTLIVPNQGIPQFEDHMKKRYNWLRIDILIKIIGLLITVIIFPQAMIISVLITLVFLVIPQQFKTINSY